MWKTDFECLAFVLITYEYESIECIFDSPGPTFSKSNIHNVIKNMIHDSKINFNIPLIKIVYCSSSRHCSVEML